MPNNNDNIIKVQQYDNGIQLFFTIFKDMNVETLYNANITLKFLNRRDNITMVRECQITDAELGECMYQLTKTDTTYVGTYTTEVEIEFANGVVLSDTNPFVLVVE